jgi:hypothetical protein
MLLPMRFLLFSAATVMLGLAQSPAATNGIAPAWDVRSTLQQLVQQADRYKAVIDKLDTATWLSQGAPSTYASQQKTVQAEVGYLRSSAARLSANPEKLSLVLDAYFRLQNLETFTVSLSEGAGRYQGAEVATTLNSLLTDNYETRYKLRQYLLELSASKEQEQAVAEREAQRCMTILSQRPGTANTSAAPKPTPRKQ